MFSRSIITLMLMMVCRQELVQSLPTGDLDPSPHTEGPKVSALREKLRRLHDILEDFEESHNSLEKHPLPKYVNGSHGVKQVSTHDSNHHDRKEKGHDIEETNPKSRAMSAEDMTRRSVERDTDEEDLDRLVTKSSKIKRNQESSIQVLARVLAQLKKDDNPQNRDKAPTKAAKVTKSETHKVVEKVPDTDLGENTLESSLLEAFAKMFEEEKAEEEARNIPESYDTSLPLFRNAGERNMKTPLIQGGQDSTMSDDHQASVSDGDAVVDENSDVADDDEDRNDIDSQSLLKYLTDAGFTLQDFKEGPSPSLSRDQAIEELEERLIEDIQLANSLGISINDLIEDLEDKAFREALVRRLNHILNSR